jgi:autotransporter-associated beta strand protein
LGSNGGAGGFGGGGGAGGSSGASGGFGGGSGATGAVSGGGGAGMGGAIFVQEGGSLTMAGAGIINGGTVTAGAAGDSGATAGSAFGSGIFIQGNNTLTFSPASGEAQILSDEIADQAGNGGGNIVGAGALTMNGAGILVISGANTYTGTTTVSAGILALVNSTGSATGTGDVNVATGAMLTGRGAALGLVHLAGGTLAPDSDQRLALGALTWNGGSTVAVSIGSSATVPVQIVGAVTKVSAGTCTISLTDAGVTPGQTYTLMSFASNTNFTASDFTVTGVSGTISLTATELRFTTAALPPVYGATLDAAKGKERATFTLTNTGDTTTSFRLAKLVRVTGGGKPGPKPPKPTKPRVELVYLLDGENITKSLANGTAAATLAPGATAQLIVKVKTHGPHKQRTIRVRLSATSVADPSVSPTAKTSFVLKANR